MENASKALIIAGAILLAIVIISLGLIVVNNTRGVADTANLSEQEVQAFNAKFTPYEGANVSGTRVKTLLQAVRASNQVNTDKKIITFTYKYYNSSTDTTATTDSAIKGDEDESKLASLEEKIIATSTYTVTFGYSNKSLINSITVQKNK